MNLNTKFKAKLSLTPIFLQALHVITTASTYLETNLNTSKAQAAGVREEKVRTIKSLKYYSSMATTRLFCKLLITKDSMLPAITALVDATAGIICFTTPLCRTYQ